MTFSIGNDCVLVYVDIRLFLCLVWCTYGSNSMGRERKSQS